MTPHSWLKSLGEDAFAKAVKSDREALRLFEMGGLYERDQNARKIASRLRAWRKSAQKEESADDYAERVLNDLKA